ncbi:MAG: universal stress protein [Rhodobacteraceae bacterium]|nr:universal stress protein [Paracoccaceae bacterium]
MAVDGSPGSKRSLEKAISMARKSKASLILAHVIEWSAFSFHTPTELEERHKRREEELDRAQEAILSPAQKQAEAAEVTCKSIIRHGHPAETLAEIASQEGADSIFIGRKGQSKIGTLLFGSVAGSLIQISPVAVTVVP